MEVVNRCGVPLEAGIGFEAGSRAFSSVINNNYFRDVDVARNRYEWGFTYTFNFVHNEMNLWSMKIKPNEAELYFKRIANSSSRFYSCVQMECFRVYANGAECVVKEFECIE